MDDAPAREAVRDKLRIALYALFDQVRVVVGDCFIERQGGLDGVLVQHCKDAKDPGRVPFLIP
jgi:hypothetical protein